MNSSDDFGEKNSERSEELLQLAQKLSRIGWWQWDIGRNSVEWSKDVEIYFGLQPGFSGLPHETFLDFVHPEDRLVLINEVNRCLERGEEFNGTYRFMLLDGSVRWISLIGNFVYDTEEKPLRLIGMAQDITRRQELERLHHEHENRLAVLVEVSHKVLREQTLSGLLAQIVEGARALTQAQIAFTGYGYREGTFRAGAFSKAERVAECMPEQLFAVRKGGVYQEVLENARSIRLSDQELRTHHRCWGLPEGHVPLRGLLAVPLTGAEGRASGMITLSDKEGGKDFTAADEAVLLQLASLASLGLQHFEAKTAAEQHAEELETIMDAVPAQIMMCRDTECRTIIGNASAHEFLRMPRRLAPLPVSTNRPTPERPTHFKIINKHGSEVVWQDLPLQQAAWGKEVRNYEFELQFPDGMVRHMLGNATPLHGADGKPYGAVSTFIDITERKQAEAVLGGINGILTQALTAETEEKVARAFLDTARNITRSAYGFVVELSSDGSPLVLALDNPGWDLCTISRPEAEDLFCRLDMRSYWARAMRRGKAQIVNDPARDPEHRGTPPGHPAVECFLGVPITRGIHALGVVGLANKPGGYQAADAKLVEDLLVAFLPALDRKRTEIQLKEARTYLEERVRERTRELIEANQILQDLSTRLLNAQEDERKLMALELHDSIAASLSAIRLKLEQLAAQQVQKNRSLAEPVADIITMIRKTTDEVRRIMTNLRPAMLDDLGLLPTIANHCREFQKLYPQITIKATMDIPEEAIPEPLKIVVFRIVQEALNNIGKHSGAQQVQIGLQRENGTLELTVDDDGRGFNARAVRAASGSGKGLGLSSMRERTQLSGGTFSIESSLNKGTRICASWRD